MAKAGKKPKSSMDAVIEVYKQGIDRTLLRENLKLTVEERILRAQDALEFVLQFRGIARRKTDNWRPGGGPCGLHSRH